MLDACEKREVQQNLVSPAMDRRRLAAALHQAQEAKVYQRVQAALLIAQGYSVDEVVRITRSRQRSVYYWMQRYLDHHRVADLYDASRTGRPRTAAQITKARILRELARDPLRLGYNTTIWTVPLLATHLSQRYDAQITSDSDARRTLPPRRFPCLLVLAQTLLSGEKDLVVAG